MKKQGKIAKLGGIWKGVKITGKDIGKSRRKLLKKIIKRWKSDK